ncbi:class D sortase [Paenibacillus filicis]|uniref:Class D sortase n=1 Tax=Paenibacillus gyeongsangnamensis TaxID=3388067 RepID=A0ABT4QHL8_9BACL|nr:class D sortase [Paenibacillus filicis]MCZ8516356.1 class D sortase [Paenibacillus filicis]
MRLWSIFLVVAGLILFAYPEITHRMEDAKQRELLASIQVLPNDGGERIVPEAIAATPVGAAEPMLPAPEPATASAERTPAAGAEKPAAAQPKPPAPKAKAEATAAMAIVRIPSIEVALPVLEGVSSGNLKSAAVHFTGTALPGRMGNVVLAAHRSYVYGRLFNRLDEVQEGDEVVLQTAQSSFTYRVTGSETVDPTEVSVLKQPKSGALLTLITCNEDGSKRLIVHAALAAGS